jgi:phage regulator Rha-like protein
MVKKLLFIICLLFIFEDLCSQNLSSDEATLTNFAKRVYNVEHFEGVKVFEIDSNKYLVIAVKIEKKTWLEVKADFKEGWQKLKKRDW